ncbi:gp317 [Bacillus phage G]|uniref:Gp317 n=1 Tax=Bacillus phage G TaxID=2884420 RepID=G3MA58_9CAUD|nr:gp317 [Bacillus phage G]AEO93576.1 gp317 [Bacillus phage G]
MVNKNMEIGIPKLEEYYMMMAFISGSRANCLNRAVGCVLVTPDNGSIISTGYNGVPKGLPHCTTCRRREEGFGPGEGLHRSRATHAEANVIIQAARYGRKVEGTIMYVTDMPCSDCCKLIINSGIKKIYYCNEYPGSEAAEILTASNIEVEQLEKSKIMRHLKLYVDAIGMM